jgi:hypothetical protein
MNVAMMVSATERVPVEKWELIIFVALLRAREPFSLRPSPVTEKELVKPLHLWTVALLAAIKSMGAEKFVRIIRTVVALPIAT